MVEIGCLEMFNRVETGRTFHCYFNPGRPMPSEAEAVHGLSDRFLSDKPAFAERAEELLAFIGDSPLIAHNASFDFGFINHELAGCGRAAVCNSRMIDTLAIARTKFPGAKHSLDALCARFGVDRSARVKHGALVDGPNTSGPAAPQRASGDPQGRSAVITMLSPRLTGTARRAGTKKDAARRSGTRSGKLAADLRKR